MTVTQLSTADQQTYRVTGGDILSGTITAGEGAGGANIFKEVGTSRLQGFETTTVPDIESKLQQQGSSQNFTGARNKVVAPVKFTDNPFNTVKDPSNKNVNLKGYSKFAPSQSKQDFSLNTPKQSKAIIDFAAGTRSNVILPPRKSAFLPTTSNNPLVSVQPTFQARDQTTGQHISSHQPPTLHHSRPPSGKSIDISKVMLRILQLELGTLTSDIERLRQKISALQIHATNLGCPNEQSNTTLREYSQDVSKLKDRSSRLFDRFDDKIDPPTRSVMEEVFCNASNLCELLAEIHDICSTDLRMPEISPELLSSVKIPKLNVTNFFSPIMKFIEPYKNQPFPRALLYSTNTEKFEANRSNCL